MEAQSDQIRAAAELLCGRRNVVALTGAGISVESGIPAFRGSQGMWSKYDPMEYASIEAFMADPEKVWRMLGEMMRVVGEAGPNPAHDGLAELEGRGILRAVITQNVDGLHHAAGSRNVVEYHGNLRELLCVSCWKRYPAGDARYAEPVPRCDCGHVLKPGIVLFGEPIPWGAQGEAEAHAKECSVLLVIGTSAQVYPACEIPHMAKEWGAGIVEINTEETPLTGPVTDIFLRGGAVETVSRLLEEVLSIEAQQA